MLNLRRHHILVVDDDEDDRDILNLCFHNIGRANFIKMVDGRGRMIDYLDELTVDQYPSLILLDYNMPRMNGREVLAELKNHQLYHHIPVAIYSSEMTAGLEKELLQAGAVACYKKSFTLSQYLDLAKTLNKTADLDLP